MPKRSDKPAAVTRYPFTPAEEERMVAAVIRKLLVKGCRLRGCPRKWCGRTGRCRKAVDFDRERGEPSPPKKEMP